MKTAPRKVDQRRDLAQNGAGEKREPWPHQVQGGKYVKLLEKFAQSLRDEDSQSAHGNQKLFLDDVFLVSLLAFYNPSIHSLRTYEDFSQTTQAERHLSTRKICRSTLSDFNAIADPKRLEPLIESLRKSLSPVLSKSKPQQGTLTELLKKTIAVDGTFLPALSNVAWAVRNKNQHGTQSYRARFDVLLRVDSWLPEAIVVPEPKQSEADSAREQIKPGNLYLYDRGYVSLPLMADHYDWKEPKTPKKQAEFVIRLKGDSASKGTITLETIREQKLTREDRAAGVVRDRIVRLSSENAAKLGLQHVELREVFIEFEENGETKTLRLLTNLLDVPAKIIGELYRYRWQVELFFRWLKVYGNFSHLISQTKSGMQLNLYVAIIGIMLMYLQTGFRPSKYLFAMMSVVASGGCTLDDIMPILRERERQNEVARRSQRLRAAKKRAEKNE